MYWHIKNDTQRIASFEYETDRDIVFDVFEDYWGDDAELSKEDG